MRSCFHGDHSEMSVCFSFFLSFFICSLSLCLPHLSLRPMSSVVRTTGSEKSRQTSSSSWTSGPSTRRTTLEPAGVRQEADQSDRQKGRQVSHPV